MGAVVRCHHAVTCMPRTSAACTTLHHTHIVCCCIHHSNQTTFPPVASPAIINTLPTMDQYEFTGTGVLCGQTNFVKHARPV